MTVPYANSQIQNAPAIALEISEKMDMDGKTSF